MATTSKPICPQCKSPLRLHELAVPRPGPVSSSRLVPKKQWVCSNEDCMYTASQHVHALSR
jgi:hypothetical protein